jgi:sulfatase maturation enzyme AslB (radical SAM superfamily)
MLRIIEGERNIIDFLSSWYSIPDTTLSIEITNLCNLRCTGCWIDKIQERLAYPISNANMSFERINQILEFGRAIGIDKIQFVGGEPTLNPFLAESISLARNIGYKRVGLTTNGSAASENYSIFMKNGLSDLSFSLDGSKASIHDNIRPTISGKSSFAEVVKNIRMSHEVAKRYKINIRVNHTLFPENIENAESAIRFSASLGVSGIRIHYAFPGDSIILDKKKKYLPTDWLIEPQRWIHLVEKCERLSDKLNISINIPRVYGENEIKRTKTIKPGYLQVRPDGTLLMCNTHDRLPEKNSRWFGRIIGEKRIEVNKNSVLFVKDGNIGCCKAIPLLIEKMPLLVKKSIQKYKGIGCIYIPSPLL